MTTILFSRNGGQCVTGGLRILSAYDGMLGMIGRDGVRRELNDETDNLSLFIFQCHHGSILIDFPAEILAQQQPMFLSHEVGAPVIVSALAVISDAPLFSAGVRHRYWPEIAGKLPHSFSQPADKILSCAVQSSLYALVFAMPPELVGSSFGCTAQWLWAEKTRTFSAGTFRIPAALFLMVSHR